MGGFASGFMPHGSGRVAVELTSDVRILQRAQTETDDRRGHIETERDGVGTEQRFGQEYGGD